MQDNPAAASASKASLQEGAPSGHLQDLVQDSPTPPEIQNNAVSAADLLDEEVIQVIQEAANSMTSSQANLGLATTYVNELGQDITERASLKLSQQVHALQSQVQSELSKRASQLNMEELKKILHRRVLSELSAVSSQYDTELMAANKELNEKEQPLGADLDSAVTVNNELLSLLAESETQWIYKVVKDFHKYDKRHISVKKDQVFVGLYAIGEHNNLANDGQEWVFGCVEENLVEMGFVPLAHLEFEKERHRE